MKLSSLFAVCLFFLLSTSMYAQTTKIGILDICELMNTTPFGETYKAAIKSILTDPPGYPKNPEVQGEWFFGSSERSNDIQNIMAKLDLETDSPLKRYATAGIPDAQLGNLVVINQRIEIDELQTVLQGEVVFKASLARSQEEANSRIYLPQVMSITKFINVAEIVSEDLLQDSEFGLDEIIQYLNY